MQRVVNNVFSDFSNKHNSVLIFRAEEFTKDLFDYLDNLIFYNANKSSSRLFSGNNIRIRYKHAVFDRNAEISSKSYTL